MQKYIAIAFRTRGLDPDFDPVPICEWCEMRLAVDVDHISGRRGLLMHDPYNLIFLCRECHTNKGGYERKERAMSVVEDKIDNARK